MGTQARKSIGRGIKTGGARRDRTADLLHAMQALSQLSYGPTWRRRTLPDEGHFVKKMNDLRGPERLGARQSRQGLGFSENCQSRINGRRHGAPAYGDSNGLREFSERDALCSRK